MTTVHRLPHRHHVDVITRSAEALVGCNHTNRKSPNRTQTDNPERLKGRAPAHAYDDEPHDDEHYAPYASHTPQHAQPTTPEQTQDHADRYPTQSHTHPHPPEPNQNPAHASSHTPDATPHQTHPSTTDTTSTHHDQATPARHEDDSYVESPHNRYPRTPSRRRSPPMSYDAAPAQCPPCKCQLAHRRPSSARPQDQLRSHRASPQQTSHSSSRPPPHVSTITPSVPVNKRSFLDNTALVHPLDNELCWHSVHRVHVPKTSHRIRVGGRAVVLDTYIDVPVAARVVSNLLRQLVETTRMTTIHRLRHHNQTQSDNPNDSATALLLTLTTTSLTTTSITLLTLLIRRRTLSQPPRNTLRITRIYIQLNRILTRTGCPRAKIRFPHPVTLLMQHPIRRIHPQPTPRPCPTTRNKLRGTKLINHRGCFVRYRHTLTHTVAYQPFSHALRQTDTDYLNLQVVSTRLITQP